MLCEGSYLGDRQIGAVSTPENKRDPQSSGPLLQCLGMRGHSGPTPRSPSLELDNISTSPNWGLDKRFPCIKLCEESRF